MWPRGPPPCLKIQDGGPMHKQMLIMQLLAIKIIPALYMKFQLCFTTWLLTWLHGAQLICFIKRCNLLYLNNFVVDISSISLSSNHKLQELVKFN